MVQPYFESNLRFYSFGNLGRGRNHSLLNGADVYL